MVTAQAAAGSYVSGGDLVRGWSLSGHDAACGVHGMNLWITLGQIDTDSGRLTLGLPLIHWFQIDISHR